MHSRDEAEEKEQDLPGFTDSPLRELNRSFKRSMSIEGSPMLTTKKIDLQRTPSSTVKRMSFDGFDAMMTTIHERSGSIQEGKVLIIPTESDTHVTGDHQENSQRTALLTGENGCLRRKELSGHLTWVSSDLIKEAPLADLLRVHEYSYIKYLETKCSSSVRSSMLKSPAKVIDQSSHNNAINAITSTNSDFNKGFPSFYSPEGYLDPDTPISPHSFEAAKKYCGAAMLAVDLLMKDEKSSNRAAFVVGRPPGHHAGPNGCVPSEHFWKIPQMASSGFCLLNTAAVAAGYARYKYSNRVGGAPRIAIVDIDIHHGNGTEEIVKNLRPHTIYLPLPSSWAPVPQLSYKPWLNEKDPDEVMFSSINLYSNEHFYPCSGSGADDTISPMVINVPLTPVRPAIWDPKVKAKITTAQKTEFCALASKEFREKVSGDLIPFLRQFRPDLLFISAGFDAHVDDMYHFLEEEDFYWVSKELSRIVFESGGKVVSILEGGYSLSSSNVVSPVLKQAKPHGTRGKQRAPSNEEEDEKIKVVEKFAQQSGDGGLVKAALAHVAGLSHVDGWMEF